MRNLAPTKTNLLKLKEELSFAELGKDLLDQAGYSYHRV